MCGNLYGWCGGSDWPKEWGCFADKDCQPKGYGYALYAASTHTGIKSHGARHLHYCHCAVAAVHFVKSRALQTRLFGQLCREMKAGHDTLLYHCEVPWLSHGKVLQRVFEPCSEMAEV